MAFRGRTRGHSFGVEFGDGRDPRDERVTILYFWPTVPAGWGGGGRESVRIERYHPTAHERHSSHESDCKRVCFLGNWESGRTKIQTDSRMEDLAISSLGLTNPFPR